METNDFRAGLKAGRQQIGLWVSSCAVAPTDVVADAGFDWLMLDMEHAPNDIPTLVNQLNATRGMGPTTMVRPPWMDTVVVKRLLDIGVPGLLFPMIQTREEAEAAVAACRYPPGGVRGFGGTSRATRYGRDKAYLQTVEAETAILVQVETVEAMERVEEIAGVDGVDGVFFGPADIAASMDKLGQIADPGVWDEIFACARRAKAMGCPVGTLVGGPLVGQVLDEGFDFVAVGLDMGILARGAEKALADARAHLSG